MVWSLITQTPTHSLKEIGPQDIILKVCTCLFWTLIFGQFPVVVDVCLALVAHILKSHRPWQCGLVWFSEQNSSLNNKNIWLHTARKCQLNQSQSSIWCQRVMSRYSKKWRRTGTRPCIWQIKVVCKVLEGNDVITITATGSGKTFTYWTVLLFVKHSIVLLVTPLKPRPCHIVTCHLHW